MKKLACFLKTGMNQDVSRSQFGPVVEEGLIIGVSIAALLILISIVLAILDNTSHLFNELVNGTTFG